MSHLLCEVRLRGLGCVALAARICNLAKRACYNREPQNTLNAPNTLNTPDNLTTLNTLSTLNALNSLTTLNPKTEKSPEL